MRRGQKEGVERLRHVAERAHLLLEVGDRLVDRRRRCAVAVRYVLRRRAGLRRARFVRRSLLGRHIVALVGLHEASREGSLGLLRVAV